LYSLV